MTLAEQRIVVYNQWVKAQDDFVKSKLFGRAKKKKVMNELERELKRIDRNILKQEKAEAFEVLANKGVNGYSQMREATGGMVSGIISATGGAVGTVLGASSLPIMAKKDNPNRPLINGGIRRVINDSSPQGGNKNMIIIVAVSALLLFFIKK
jgi:hypothetical protein